MWRKARTRTGTPERWLVLDVESSGLDAPATAELLLQLLPSARADGVSGFRALARLAARRRWLP